MSAEDQKTDVLMALVAEMRLERRGGTRAMIGLLTVIMLAVGIAVVFLGSRESAGIRAEAAVHGFTAGFELALGAYQVSLSDAHAEIRTNKVYILALQRDMLKGKFSTADEELITKLQEVWNERDEQSGQASGADE